MLRTPRAAGLSAQHTRRVYWAMPKYAATGHILITISRINLVYVPLNLFARRQDRFWGRISSLESLHCFEKSCHGSYKRVQRM